MRSRKLAALARSLKPPTPHGADEGELLVVGWGSTLGAIEEAVDQLRAEGHAVASLHLRFLSPLEPGLEKIFRRFRRVMTVEINYSDEPAAPGVEFERRRAQLAQILRERTLVDIDCWSTVRGQPYGPGEVAEAVRRRLGGDKGMTKGDA
jgi:2-oxoglutarate ferredoxin oxidoreductase subunit alpha